MAKRHFDGSVQGSSPVINITGIGSAAAQILCFIKYRRARRTTLLRYVAVASPLARANKTVEEAALR
jgi:hypothetical protein